MICAMPAIPDPDDRGSNDALLTVDELSARVGMTVRTLRFYAGRGLIPPPV
ncbi:MAG: MerR family transcriptional regulator, partial [Nocardioidaceae bacterium]